MPPESDRHRTGLSQKLLKYGSHPARPKLRFCVISSLPGIVMLHPCLIASRLFQSFPAINSSLHSTPPPFRQSDIFADAHVYEVFVRALRFTPPRAPLPAQPMLV
ncbi:unnamed protein product [Protopolystoma xenopodis]|uniref:Uncharacterized protein n=1 Tax=Protopolystoma xenopodis TaxID=117903 RepID=A0A3S5C291_9PLAT|nr:unnamed protein product [Protopolystoma xenopodis]